MSLAFANFGQPSGLLVYMDDVIGCSATWEAHLRLLEDMFRALQTAGLTLKPSKNSLRTKGSSVPWAWFICLQYSHCKALLLSARASPLRVLGFLRRSALRRSSRSVSRPYKDSYDSSARPMGVASQNYTLPCAIATFPVSLPLSSTGNVWPRLPLLPSTRP